MKNENTTETEAHASPAKKATPIVMVMRWVLVAVWAGVIFFMSSNSGSNLNDDLGFFSQTFVWLHSFQESITGPGIDLVSPIAHFFEYAIFSFILINALWQHMSLKKACILAILIASLYGVTDEFHQWFVPERTADPVDWIVDTLGASFGVLVGYPLIQKINAMQPSQKK